MYFPPLVEKKNKKAKKQRKLFAQVQKEVIKSDIHKIKLIFNLKVNFLNVIQNIYKKSKWPFANMVLNGPSNSLFHTKDWTSMVVLW